MSYQVQRPIHVTGKPPTEPAMPPVRREDNGERSIADVYEASDSWAVGEWSRASLVVSRAALKDMLSMIEREMGQRKLMPPYRETR